jgi:hypothetical protein
MKDVRRESLAKAVKAVRGDSETAFSGREPRTKPKNAKGGEAAN